MFWSFNNELIICLRSLIKQWIDTTPCIRACPPHWQIPDMTWQDRDLRRERNVMKYSCSVWLSVNVSDSLDPLTKDCWEISKNIPCAPYFIITLQNCALLLNFNPFQYTSNILLIIELGNDQLTAVYIPKPISIYFTLCTFPSSFSAIYLCFDQCYFSSSFYLLHFLSLSSRSLYNTTLILQQPHGREPWKCVRGLLERDILAWRTVTSNDLSVFPPLSLSWSIFRQLPDNLIYVPCMFRSLLVFYWIRFIVHYCIDKVMCTCS